MLPTACGSGGGGGGDNVHCNLLPPLAPWLGTSPPGTGIPINKDQHL